MIVQAPGPEKAVKPIEEIRAALQKLHHYATGQSDRPYMEIPANPDRDADLVLSAAIDELAGLRAELADSDGQVETLHADAKFLRAQLAEARDLLSTSEALKGFHEDGETAAKAALQTATATIKTLEIALAALRRVLSAKIAAGAV